MRLSKHKKETLKEHASTKTSKKELAEIRETRKKLNRAEIIKTQELPRINRKKNPSMRRVRWADYHINSGSNVLKRTGEVQAHRAKPEYIGLRK